jgi:hypothetical protein
MGWRTRTTVPRHPNRILRPVLQSEPGVFSLLLAWLLFSVPAGLLAAQFIAAGNAFAASAPDR